MPQLSTPTPAERVSTSRELILLTAERLFAENGISAVSNRQVSEAAGQGNNSAVGYHFGTKLELVKAISTWHGRRIEERRQSALARLQNPKEVRSWVACMVRPVTEHLDSLEQPTRFARFGAQLMTDPQFRRVLQEQALEAPSLHQILDGLNRCLPEMPPEVRDEREDMARQLTVHICSERERALAEGTRTPRASWSDAATGLIDGITALWLAPYTSTGQTND